MTTNPITRPVGANAPMQGQGKTLIDLIFGGTP